MPLGLTLPQRAGRAQGSYFCFGRVTWAVGLAPLAGLLAVLAEAFTAAGLAGFCSLHAMGIGLARCKCCFALRATTRLAGRRAAALAGLPAETTTGTDAGKENAARFDRSTESALGAAALGVEAAFTGNAAATAIAGR